jgi:hypothetical protein
MIIALLTAVEFYHRLAGLVYGLNDCHRLILVPGAAHYSTNTLMLHCPHSNTIFACIIQWVEIKNLEVPEAPNRTLQGRAHEGDIQTTYACPLHSY